MENFNLVRRCCVCKSAILDGEVVPREIAEERMSSDSVYSDGILSYECALNLYGRKIADSLLESGAVLLTKCSSLDGYFSKDNKG